MKVHADIVIFGKVQGVTFRYSSRLKAQQLELFGIVKNMPNGSVNVEVEGEREKVNKFIAWCHEGPDLALVEKVEVTFSPILKNYSSFESIHNKHYACMM